MMRSAVSLPPSWEDTALMAMTSGIVAVSAPEASAIARSKPAIFWKRLTTRSTNSGRSQNVNVRAKRRWCARPFASAEAFSDAMTATPVAGLARSLGHRGRRGIARQG
jgi:hypothetical protein